MHANNVQYPFAEQVGIAFASPGKVNDSLGDGFVDVVVAVRAQGDTSSFESNTEDTPSLGVEVLAVKESCNWHSALPSLRRERDMSLSHRAPEAPPLPAIGKRYPQAPSGCVRYSTH